VKILFIKPAMHPSRKTKSFQPLAFAILSALTPPEIERVFYDESIESIPLDEPADLVAMSVETFTARRAYQIASIYMKRNIPVIMGGFHPTIEPDEALEHATAVAIGDAEGVWPQVISDLKEGRLRSIYRNNSETGNIVTSFDRSIFRNKKYLPFNLVQWTRGCKFKCDFCAIKSFYPKTLSSRPIDEVIQEIRGLDNKPVFIVDDNLYQNRTDLKEFLKKITLLNKRWACQISIDITNDDELMDLLGNSGCILVLVGIESLSIDNLKQMNKSSNLSVSDYKSAINKFRKYGIMIYGTFIFGYEYDTNEQFEKALEFAKKMKFAIANFNPLYPIPGTELYTRLKHEHRLLFDKWWLDNDFYYGKAMLKPVKLSSNELEDGCFRAKRSFNSKRSILLRALDFKSNSKNYLSFLIFMILNITNRKQVYRKQGKRLGIAE
jgi:radical SAM superfamily enzyme YgiQ (UPF0313 family)